MKNLIKYLGLLTFVMIVPIAIFAQGTDPVALAGFDPASYFATLAAFVAAVIAVTQFVKKTFLKTSGFWTVAMSWIVAVALAFVGWMLQYGIFAGLQWYWALIYALAAGLIGNGIMSESIINALLSLVPKKKSLK